MSTLDVEEDCSELGLPSASGSGVKLNMFDPQRRGKTPESSEVLGHSDGEDTEDELRRLSLESV